MGNTLRICLAGLVLATVTGCGPSAFIDGAYRSATYDDIVYVKANKTLYKRRNRDGLFMHPALAKQKAGHVWPSNKNIRIYTNYMVAYEDLTSRGIDFKVDPESRPDIAYRTHPRSVGSYGAADPSQPINLNIPIADRGEKNAAARRAFAKLGQKKVLEKPTKKPADKPKKEPKKDKEAKPAVKVKPEAKPAKPNTNAEENPAVAPKPAKLKLAEKKVDAKAPAAEVKNVTTTVIIKKADGTTIKAKTTTTTTKSEVKEKKAAAKETQ